MFARVMFLFVLLIAAAYLVVPVTPSAALLSKSGGRSVAIFAGGCFWCVESDFDKVPGVISTTSGYIGGKASTANYKDVSGGGTRHYEAVRIVFDAKKVTYRKLLNVFWRSIDPTDPGGQFCDRGYSYKTAVFALNAKQRREARASRKTAQKALGRTIVTTIRSAGKFYRAEGYHQNFHEKNPVRYLLYRIGCGRDAKVRSIWGSQAHAGIKKN